MLKLKDVHTSYGKTSVLKCVNLNVEEGEIVALLGANGSGKTTAIMAISGLARVSSGDIKFLGERIDRMTPFEIVRRGISQVPEGRRIFPRLSVRENLEMGGFICRDKDILKKKIDMAFELFPRLAERQKQMGGTLSGGEQQMLAIARGLMANPKLLLLDEPSLGLSPILVQVIFETIRRINKDGVAILLVEQNAKLALAIANRGYVLETGSIILSDGAQALLKNEMVRKAYLGGTSEAN